jgi:dsRNA-specific ribonuclease
MIKITCAFPPKKKKKKKQREIHGPHRKHNDQLYVLGDSLLGTITTKEIRGNYFFLL